MLLGKNVPPALNVQLTLSGEQVNILTAPKNQKLFSAFLLNQHPHVAVLPQSSFLVWSAVARAPCSFSRAVVYITQSHRRNVNGSARARYIDPKKATRSLRYTFVTMEGNVWKYLPGCSEGFGRKSIHQQ